MPEPTRNLIIQAARIVEQDGCQAADAATIRAVLSSHDLTDLQIRSLWTILGRYQDGLASRGMDYNSFIPPANGVVHRDPPETYVPTKVPLRSFQISGVKWIEAKNGRALITDEPGVGKTPQALGYLARHPEALPVLVVCPASIRMTWVGETKKFTDLRPLVIVSKTSLKAFQKQGIPAALFPEPGYDIVIMNYDLLEAQTPTTWAKALEEGDESIVPFLLEAGKYATKALNKVYTASLDIDGKGRILEVLKAIGAQGKKSNRKRFAKAFVNGRSLEDFLAFSPKTLIGDELHSCKDARSQRAMAMELISKKVINVIGLTGTPVVNRPIELFSQVRIVNPQVFPDFMAFAMHHCAAKTEEVQVKGAKRGTTQKVWDFSGASNLEELNDVLRKTVMIRRLKSEVLSELPKKIRVTIPLVLEGKQGDEYRKEAAPAIKRLSELKKEQDEWKKSLEGQDETSRARFIAEHAEEALRKNRLTGDMMGEIEKLKQATVKAKYKQCLDFILNAHEEQDKVIVFTVHHDTTDLLTVDLRDEGVKVDVIDGRVAGHLRDPIKDRFQTGDLGILVCGIRAASEGITLTASHTVIVTEFDWNPSRHDQAEARVDRFGQTVPPTIYYLVGVGTVEERLVAMIESKREVVNASLGEGERTLEEAGIVDALVEDILRKEST